MNNKIDKILAEISAGELFDKITILEIKKAKISNKEKLNDIDLPEYEKPTPLTAPFWFECFNAENITKDLANGKASAFLFKKEEFDGIDNVIAIYPDGTSYRWRQLNTKYMKE